MNGTVSAISSHGFTVRVGQSFGNCPQYIQARSVVLTESHHSPQIIRKIATLTEAERTTISAADTFFIATAFYGDPSDFVRGVDVSHRGGKPGFIRIDPDGTLNIPDFAGNLHFNTIGNLLLKPQAGLLFLDFNRGDLIYLTGTAEVIWDINEIQAFAGAERLIRFQTTQGYRVERSLPLQWSTPDYSPFLDRIGAWTETA